MAQEKTTNTFTQGMVMDINELDTPRNDYCTTALNATAVTFNGNEGAIQNEMGNVQIKTQYNDTEIIASLPATPIGSVEYGGVIYYVLLYPDDANNEGYCKCEIGSFPSPNWDSTEKHSLIWNYAPLRVGLIQEDETYQDVDLVSYDFKFDLNHPVNILVEPSFDGSVNLILNDGQAKPRLINSGFHVQDNNQCKVIERYDNNNTNRYLLSNSDIFNLQTSLYRNFSKLSKFEYLGTTDGGDLKVGNYVFYAVSCDKDGNESDIICESGVVSVFIGEDGNPFSVQGGLENQNSYKSVQLKIENVDSAYSYLKLYYTRTSAQNNQMAETLAYKVDKLYPVKNETCKIIFTGNEVIESISVDDLNTQYFNANSVKAQALNQNMLFLANVEQNNGEDSKEYVCLRDLSLKFYPIARVNKKVVYNLDSNYKTKDLELNDVEEGNYYQSKFIYDYTGYHEEEYYRFGVVYIRKDGSLTSVFNVLGNTNLGTTERKPSALEFTFDQAVDEIPVGDTTYNNKGVVKFEEGLLKNLTDIIGIQFRNFDFPVWFDNTYKGFFFVRQKRIPTILAQGYATNVCEESYLPSINVKTNNDKKGYLYESFVKGAFRYAPDEGIYPRRSVSKGSLVLMNSYSSRIFTLTDNTYAYLDKLNSNGPVTSAIQTVGIPSKALLQAPTCEVYEHYVLDEDNKKEEKEYTCLYFALRANGATTFYTDDKDKDAIYVCVILENLTTPPSISKDNFKGYDDDGTISYDNLKNDHNKDDDTFVCLGDYIYQNNKKSQYFKQILKCLFSGKQKEDTYDYGDSWGLLGYVDTNTHEAYATVNDGVQTTTVEDENGNKSTVISGYNDLSGYYRLHRIFYAKPGTYTWTAGINTLYKLMYKYCTEKEPLTGTSTSTLFDDPDSPTWNGKYTYTEDVKSDTARQKIYPMQHKTYAIFCPEYELNQPYYNNIFTGQNFTYRALTPENLFEVNKKRLYSYNKTLINRSKPLEGKSINVAENVSMTSLMVDGYVNSEYSWKNSGNLHFSTKAGTAQEVNYKYVGFPFISHVQSEARDADYTTGKTNIRFPFNLVRGIYGPYLGTYIADDVDISGKIVNIYAPNYNNSDNVKIRAQDSSPYQAISDRITRDESNKKVFYRGDCYIGYFTHRVNRNFQDPTSQFNDTIVDFGSFSKGFAECFEPDLRTLDTTKDGAKYFNLGDINAIQLGSWVTFPVRSTMNISLRSVDRSYIDEALLCGNSRAFYPLHGIDVSGSYKIPESEAFNVGYNKSGSEKQFFNVNQLVFNKVYYKNRIVYSNVLQQSALTNGTRVFLAEHYRDYTDQYGEIVKLISLKSNLLCVCEHGILLIPVNERALAAEGEGGNVFINTSNVLPENPLIISDTYGSKWQESIISTPYGIYGVDESNKKIWYTDGQTVKIISDFKVQEFLNNYLKVTNDLKIRECNIKSYYIRYKNDVIFTLYDKDTKYEHKNENIWSLCWNINEECWRTFYSWIPVDAQNIGNNFISVNLFTNKELENVKHYANKKYIPQEVDSFDYLWKHGHSQRVPSTEYIKPTNWYGQQHPFEFEFVVKDKPEVHKIFDNLQIISNKAAPESFHYEIVGECYDFNDLKEVAYVRQEKLKELYESVAKLSYKDTSDIEVKYNANNFGRAIMFPQYYARQDIPLQLYDNYKQMSEGSHDYNYLTGTELIRNKKLNEYRLCNHVKAVDITNGILRGNMNYKEDKWDIQINPINYLVSNESNAWWNGNNPPIVLDNIKLGFNSEITVPENLMFNSIYQTWNIAKRKEIAVKDKFIKVKIRYSGEDLAVISAINTLYRISYT